MAVGWVSSKGRGVVRRCGFFLFAKQTPALLFVQLHVMSAAQTTANSESNIMRLLLGCTIDDIVIIVADKTNKLKKTRGIAINRVARDMLTHKRQSILILIGEFLKDVVFLLVGIWVHTSHHAANAIKFARWRGYARPIHL